MNAVVKSALFAEAEIVETTPDFTSEDELPNTGPQKKSSGQNKQTKKKAGSKRKKMNRTG
jgi:hypothetical protein